MRKSIISFLCIIIIFISSFSAPAYAGSYEDKTTWPEGPGIFADAAIVMEASTGLILYEKNMHETHYPASITKVLSALLVIENSSPGDVVTFSKDAIYSIERDSTHLGIDVGEQLTIQQCLYGILLESANEVTYGAGEHVAGNMSSFVEMMNERAKGLGALNSNFTNPHGLPDENHYTTAYDMALITREAMKNQTFRKVTGTRTYQYPPTNKQVKTRYLRNHHKFILKQDYNYEGTIGGKTGYTSKAKYTLVTIAKRGDLELICVILKDDTRAHQYEDTIKLLDYGFNNFSIYPINEIALPNTVQESPFFTRYNTMLDSSDTSIKTDENGYLVLPNIASSQDAIKEVSFYPEAEIKQGHNVIGAISYTYDGMYVGGADILCDNFDTPTLIHTVTNPITPTSVPDLVHKPVAEASSGNFKPIIIGMIVGVFVLIIGLYFVLVEKPRLKRRHEYNKKRSHRKMDFSDDSYLDL